MIDENYIWVYDPFYPEGIRLRDFTSAQIIRLHLLLQRQNLTRALGPEVRIRNTQICRVLKRLYQDIWGIWGNGWDDIIALGPIARTTSLEDRYFLDHPIEGDCDD